MKENIYKNILVIVAGLLGFYVFFKVEKDNDVVTLLYICTIIGIGSILIPPFARLVNYLWMKLALGLGWINSRILLSIVFYIFMFPLAAISRLFTKDPLSLKRKQQTVYSERNHTYQKEDLENIW